MPVCHFALGKLIIALRSDGATVTTRWSTIFDDEGLTRTAAADITLTLSLVETPPPWPERFDVREPISGLGVVHHDDGNALYFAAGAYAFIERNSSVIEGQITRSCLPYIEDVTYTFLAAACRRSGHYLLHAFAAEKNGRALLLVAPSGGGKTTTGLALLQSGYRLLANDTVVLTRHHNTLFAHPTPEQIQVRRPTFALLGSLCEVYRPLPTSRFLRHFKFEPGETTPITAVCVLDLQPERPCALTLLPKPMALACLLEASVDRWDKNTLAAHTGFLQRLCAQAKTYRLRVGRDVVTEVAEMLERGDAQSK